MGSPAISSCMGVMMWRYEAAPSVICRTVKHERFIEFRLWGLAWPNLNHTGIRDWRGGASTAARESGLERIVV